MTSAITVWLYVVENAKLSNERNLERFNAQAFLHEIYQSDLNLVCFMDDVELARDYVKETFVGIIDKYTLLEDKVRGRDKPWFNDSLATAIEGQIEAWVKAKRNSNDKCLLNYRHSFSR